MFGRSLLLGLVSGLLAGIASLLYQKVYTTSLGADFSAIVKPATIIAGSLLVGMIASVVYYALVGWLHSAGAIVFNFAYVILSFAGILLPFAIKLPLTVDTPELFPGLLVPMLFYPALGWFTLKPLFLKEQG